MTRDNLIADIDPAAATIIGRTPTTLAEWLDAADPSSLDPNNLLARIRPDERASFSPP